MAFFGRYIEVTPHSRLVWTNEESDDGAVTTVTFEEKGGKTLLVMHELYPSKEALDGAIAGMEGGMRRDVRATGRASRHAGRERAKIRIDLRRLCTDASNRHLTPFSIAECGPRHSCEPTEQLTKNGIRWLGPQPLMRVQEEVGFFYFKRPQFIEKS